MNDLTDKFISLCKKGEHKIYYKLSPLPKILNTKELCYDYFYCLNDSMYRHAIDDLGLFDYKGVDFYKKVVCQNITNPSPFYGEPMREEYYATIFVEIDYNRFGLWHYENDQLSDYSEGEIEHG